jgi:D-beta-D-heptose 7-phosphate kinase / D-beta-D-heptose 1-phosphate adenosyltransferase
VRVGRRRARRRASQLVARDGRDVSRLVVVGDALLDSDLVGDVERLSPEAPVPVVDARAESKRPGGAALAAVLAARDGHDVALVTALGRDLLASELANLLWDAGVEVIDLGLDGSTPHKLRVLGNGRVLLRVDRGDAEPGKVGLPGEAVERTFEQADAVLVSDYGRGVAAEPALRALLERVVVRTPVVWDPHPRGPEPVPSARLATPNRSEAALFAPESSGEGLHALARRAHALRERWRVQAAAITLGAEGALLVDVSGVPLFVHATPAVGGDPCGAGDRFAVSAAAALGEGALLTEAVERAVAEASGFVAAGGAASVSVEPAGPPHAVHQDEGAEALAARIREQGGTVVATGGCFDLLHAGHVTMLETARALGDCLIVLVNSDESVRRLKGPGRPLVPEEDRVAVLQGLSAVDAVVVFEEDTPELALARVRPHVFAKGADYSLDELPEAALVESWGGQAVLLPYVAGRSTTRLIEEVQLRGAT